MSAADGGAQLRSVGDLDGDAQRALRREVLRLADSKRVLGLRYSDWLLGAPSIEAGISASAMAQDEWGHARLLYAMLKDFDEDPIPVEHDRETAAWASTSALDTPIPDWAAWVATVAVVDGALEEALRSLAEGAYDTAGSRVPKMLAEEVFHADLADAWIASLADGAVEGRDRLRTEALRLLPIMGRFVAPGDGDSAALREWGLSDEEVTRGRVEERMLGVLAPILDEAQIRAALASGEGRGWDEVRGRTDGAPDDEVIERARGDRNRELFVE